MKRVLVTGVGSSDPFGRTDPATGAPTLGPILTLLEHLERQGEPPDTLVLAVTVEHLHEVELEDGRLGAYRQAGMEQNADRLEEELRRRAPAMHVARIPLRVDPTDLDEVIDALQRGVRPLRLGRADVQVHLTSGTPAMMTALTFLADAGPLPARALWHVLDPTALRDHQTGQPLPARRVRRVHLGHLSERARLERSLALLRGMAFGFAAHELRTIAERSLVDGRRARARAVERLARAWDHWDRADFGEAQRLMTEANRALRRAGLARVREAIDAQRAALAEIAAELDARKASRSKPASGGAALLRDAYAAILRRAATGDGVGVAAQARWLYEEVLDHCLRQAGLSPRGVTPAELARLGRVSARGRAAVEVAAEAAKLQASRRAPIDLHALDLDARREIVVELGRAGAVAGLSGERLGTLEDAGRQIAGVALGPGSRRALKALVEAATCLMVLIQPGGGARTDLAGTPFGARSVLAAVDAIEREL
jgi:hypothetical protein